MKILTNVRKWKVCGISQILNSFLSFIENHKKSQEKLLIEECKEMYDDMLKISKEWKETLMDGLDKNEKWKDLEEGI